MSGRDDDADHGDEESESDDEREEQPAYAMPADRPEGIPENVPDDWLDPKPFDPAGR